MNHFTKLILLPCVILIVAGCSGSDTVQKFQQGQWRIVSYFDGTLMRPALSQSPAYITFLPDGTIGGSAGCGQFIGIYKITGGTLLTVEATSELTGSCTSEDERQDALVTNAFNNVSLFEMQKNQILLKSLGGDTQIVLTQMGK